jgi:peptidoglycan/xylan/chitin deacetylase (PgdA/CDA1 family)
MLRYSYSLLSPQGRNSRLSILIFHRVYREEDLLCPGEVTAKRFDQILGYLKHWFNIIPLYAAVAGLSEGSLPSRPLCITFDDGYADNYECALPLLKKHGLHATFFIATGYLDGGCMFNDKIVEAVRGSQSEVLDLSTLNLATYLVDSVENKRQAIDQLLGQLKYTQSPERERVANEICYAAGIAPPTKLMMRSEQLKKLHQAGMGIGGHTRNHPILSKVESATAMQEIVEGKADVEEVIGAPIELFAYPNGRPGLDYLTEHVSMVREAGFISAVSTAKGVSSSAADLFQLPRFTPWDQSKWKFAIRMGTNLRSRAHERV